MLEALTDLREHGAMRRGVETEEGCRNLTEAADGSRLRLVVLVSGSFEPHRCRSKFPNLGPSKNFRCKAGFCHHFMPTRAMLKGLQEQSRREASGGKIESVALFI